MGRSNRKQKGGPHTKQELIRHAGLRLAAGNAKQALASLRLAQFNGVPAERLDQLFHRAYLARAGELEARGLTEEAEAARKNAAMHGSSSGNLEPTRDDLLPYLHTQPADSRLAYYARYLQSNNPPCPDAEVMLADHLVLNRCWEQLDALPEACPFRDDANVVAAASEPLDCGNWDAGSRILDQLPAESGFRHWKAFCSAMAAHVRRDMPTVAKDLKALPSEFPLRSATKALRASARPRAAESASARAGTERLLGIGRLSISKRAEAVRQAVEGAKTEPIVRAIRDFATAVDPHSPTVTMQRLIRILHLAVETGQLNEDTYWDAFSRAVPERQSESVEILLYCQSLFKKPSSLDYLTEIAEMFPAIRLAFPDESDRRVARARILGRLAEGVQSRGTWAVTYQDAEDICQILGDLTFNSVEKYARDGLSAAIDLMRLSVREDPSNAAAHKQLIAMLESGLVPRTSELISAYEHYAESVPEDPEPWISLAELRLGNNAYRKAEAALEKARIYASQDNRVIDLMAATSLLATKRNLKRGRLALAVRDLSNAEAIASPRTEAIVLAWKVIASFAQAKESSLLASGDRLLDDATPPMRAKAACIVANALPSTGGSAVVPRTDRLRLQNMFRDAVRETCKTAPADLADLVEPMPVAFSCVTGPKVVPEDLGELWDCVLRAVPDRDALRIFPAALEVGALRELRGEIARRLARTDNSTYQRILLLYSATLRYLLGEDRGAGRFRKLVDSIPKQELGPVRAAADKLVIPVAMRFVPVLALALKQFDFELLEEQWGLF